MSGVKKTATHSYRHFMSRLGQISANDPRYKTDAYVFVMAALGRALRGLETPRHITGSELLRWIREEAIEQFGPMGRAVFESWGLKNSLDFGYIVFNMVREGILSKTETDKLEDFTNEDFFENLFDETSGYRPIEDEKFLKDIAKITKS